MRKNSFTADFETTIDTLKTRVWGWGIASIKTGRIVAVNNSMDSFMNYIKGKNIDLYFHNLKFDGMFIISWLLNNGFIHEREKRAGTFETLITDSGQFFKITIYWSTHKKRYVKTDIYDSLKKLPFSVEKIAKDFHLKISKRAIDYKAPRPEGHVLTYNEVAYIINDVVIMAQALKIQFDAGLQNMTIASDALGAFKDTMGGDKGFKFYFKVLDYEIDKSIRRSYKGGFTYLNPRFKATNQEGLVYDVNSLYPSVMYDSLLPYGSPIFFEGKYKPLRVYPVYIQRLRCAFKIKRGYIPTIQLRNHSRFIETEYLESSKGEIVELVLTSVDLDLFLTHYDVMNLEYLDGYCFKASREFFKEYIDHWGGIKEKAVGAERQLAKLMLNSLYGKFATATERRKKSPYLKDDKTLGFSYDEEEIGNPIYTALASFVTAYARKITIESAQLNYDRFIYADTDSLHIKGYEIPDNITIHESKIGAWSLEAKFTESKFLRAKTYIEKINDKWHVTCAGMPHSLHNQVTYDNFTEGAIYQGKLRPTQVEGGVVLVESTFRIKTSNKESKAKETYKAPSNPQLEAIKAYRKGIDLTSIKKDIKYLYGHYQVMSVWHKLGAPTMDVVAEELKTYGVYLESNNEADLFVEMLKVYNNLKED